MTDDRTYEKAPGGAPASGLDGYTVFDERGEVVGRVIGVNDVDGRIELLVAEGSPPFGGTPVTVSWEAVRDVDHERLAIEVAEVPDAVLGHADVVEGSEGAEARRVEDVPGGTPPPSPPGERRTRPRLVLPAAWGLGFVSVFLFLPVLALVDADGTRWLILLVVPAAGLAASVILTLRGLRSPYEPPASTDRT